MTDLPATRPLPPSRELQSTRTLAGALLGALLWLGLIAIGVPNILWGTPGYTIILLAAPAGALLARTRLFRLLVAVAIALAAVLAAAAYTPVMTRPTRALVRADSLPPNIQAIVVLSGGITSDGHLGPSAADRLLSGLLLVRRGVANTLILSRERPRDRHRHGLTSDADQQRLISLLERPIRLLIVDSIYSTRDEAVRMRALAQTIGVTRIALVTSPTHTYRACAAFEKVGFAVACVPSESRSVALRRQRFATDRVRALQLCLYELAGLTLYRARGWI